MMAMSVAIFSFLFSCLVDGGLTIPDSEQNKNMNNTPKKEQCLERLRQTGKVMREIPCKSGHTLVIIDDIDDVGDIASWKKDPLRDFLRNHRTDDDYGHEPIRIPDRMRKNFDCIVKFKKPIDMSEYFGKKHQDS